MKKIIALLLALCLTLSLCACGASAPTENLKAESSNGGYDYMADGVYDSVEMESPAEMPEAGASGNTGSAGVQNQKLIRTMSLDTETEDLDALLTQLNQKISALGGYVENKSVRNGGSTSTRRYRYANMVIRVPVDRLDEFVEHVAGATNVVSQTESAEDITLSYVATQSRITALETEQTRLLELLAQAENMTDLLQIEQRLTDVRTELEQVTSQLRLYDNLVDYGTIDLSITEVQEYTPVEKETIWQRMGSGLKASWESLCEFAENFLVFFISALPWLIPLSAIVALIVVSSKNRRKKKAARKATQAEPPKES